MAKLTLGRGLVVASVLAAPMAANTIWERGMENRTCLAMRNGELSSEVFPASVPFSEGFDFAPKLPDVPSVDEVITFCREQYEVEVRKDCAAQGVVNANLLYADREEESPLNFLLEMEAASIVNSVRAAGQQVCPVLH